MFRDRARYIYFESSPESPLVPDDTAMQHVSLGEIWAQIQANKQRNAKADVKRETRSKAKLGRSLVKWLAPGDLVTQDKCPTILGDGKNFRGRAVTHGPVRHATFVYVTLSRLELTHTWAEAGTSHPCSSSTQEAQLHWAQCHEEQAVWLHTTCLPIEAREHKLLWALHSPAKKAHKKF